MFTIECSLASSSLASACWCRINLSGRRRNTCSFDSHRRRPPRVARQIGNCIIAISCSLLFEFQLIVFLVITQVTRWR